MQVVLARQLLPPCRAPHLWATSSLRLPRPSSSSTLRSRQALMDLMQARRCTCL